MKENGQKYDFTYLRGFAYQPRVDALLVSISQHAFACLKQKWLPQFSFSNQKEL